jgi:hypothetical protein
MSAPDLNTLSNDPKKHLLETTNNSNGLPSVYVLNLLKSLYEPIVPTATPVAEKRTDEVINSPLKHMELPAAAQTVSDVDRLKRRIEELKVQVEKLEEQCTNLENGYSELKEQVAALGDNANEDDSAEDADDEAVDTPAESEEEEEEEEVEPPAPAAPKRDESLPCEITTAASLLVLVYVFRLFLYVCDLTSCSRNRIMLKDL